MRRQTGIQQDHEVEPDALRVTSENLPKRACELPGNLGQSGRCSTSPLSIRRKTGHVQMHRPPGKRTGVTRGPSSMFVVSGTPTTVGPSLPDCVKHWKRKLFLTPVTGETFLQFRRSGSEYVEVRSSGREHDTSTVAVRRMSAVSQKRQQELSRCLPQNSLA